MLDLSPGDLHIVGACVQAEIKRMEAKRANYLRKGTIVPPSGFRFREKRLQSIKQMIERAVAEKTKK